MSGPVERRPLRVLLIDEGVLGHRTLTAQLREALDADPEIEARFETVPPPSRPGRLFLRRARGLGDADLFELRWRLRWSWRVRRLLRRHAGWAEVAFVNTQASALLAKGPMRRLPTVLSVDATLRQFTALEYRGARDRFSPHQERVAGRLEGRALRAAARVLAWTEWNAAALRSEHGLSEPRLVTLHPGLDAGWWGEAARSRPRSREGPLRVLFVGNETRRKGLDTLLEAIRRPGVDAVLDVVTGDEVSERDGVTVQRGVEARSERLRDIYAAADVFALPTEADAVPWSVLEAMATGLPVVASAVGAIPELVGDAGETIEAGDAGALAAALRRLADPAERDRAGEAAIRRVRQRYDADTQLPRLADVLREAAGREGEAEAGRGVRRRTVIAAGAGAAGLALAAPYLTLLPPGDFKSMVASRLGIEEELAGELLQRARESYGDVEYEARATAFALAVRDPAAAVLPGSARERAVSAMVEPMLSAPASTLGYATTGVDPGGLAPCSGLVGGG